MSNDKQGTPKGSEPSIPLSESEKLVLSVLADLGADARGETIRQELKQCTGRAVSLGAIYLVLDRLEAKGCVKSFRSQAERHYVIIGAQE